MRSTRRSPSSTTGAKHPSTAWRRQFSLLLGLERVLSEDEPKLADGTILSSHQVDALSGTLVALLAESQRDANGNGRAGRAGRARAARRRSARPRAASPTQRGREREELEGDDEPGATPDAEEDEEDEEDEDEEDEDDDDEEDEEDDELDEREIRADREGRERAGRARGR